MRVKALILCAILAVVMIFSVGCGSDTFEDIAVELGKTSQRLECVETSMYWTIWRDTKTNVMYLFGHNCVVTMMDSDGKPLLYEESEVSK